MSENQAIVPAPQPVGPTALAQGGAGMEGWEIKPAAMSLDQRTTTVEGAQPGKFRDTLTGNVFDSLQVVPLGIFTTRVLFPEGGELGADPVCRSNDGIRVAPDAQVPQCNFCKDCDQGPKLWNNYRKTGKKPPCQEKARLMFVLRDSGLPYFITIGGMSLKQVRNLKTAIARDAAAEAAKGSPRSLFDYTFEMRAIKVDGKKGTYYLVNFSNLRKVTTPGEFGPLYEKFILRQRANELDTDEAYVTDGELVEDTPEDAGI